MPSEFPKKKFSVVSWEYQGVDTDIHLGKFADWNEKNRRKKKDLLHNRPLTNHTLVVLLWTRAFLDIQTERQCFGSHRCYSLKGAFSSHSLLWFNDVEQKSFALVWTVFCYLLNNGENERKITFKIESYSFTIKSSSSSSSCCSFVFVEV